MLLHLFYLHVIIFSQACIFFEAGHQRDGYFDSDGLLEQVERAIDIFDSKCNGTMTGLFMFDNAPSHQKRNPDALSARKMIKNPKLGWTPTPDGPRMRNGKFADGREQEFYYSDDHPTMPGWFKGSAQILQERGLFQEGMRATCEKSCFDNKENLTCCCRKALFYQPDFVAQKSQLQEYIESRGHLCDFYPKFHCELNFIEQYWVQQSTVTAQKIR
jgi:hypothetical protein